MMMTANSQSLPPAAPPVSPRQNTQPDDTSAEHKQELIFRKVVEPSLGTVNHKPIRRGASPSTTSSSHRLYGHLYTLKTRPKAHSSLPGQNEYVQEDIISVQRRSSSPMSYKSYNSTTRVKQLPLPHHAHTTMPFPRVGSARGVRSVPVCTERYLGTDRDSSKVHLRSKSMEHIRSPHTFTPQVKRFEEEQRALYRTRTLRRVTEMYSHRVDQQYYMAGSGVGLGSKYHVDDAELQRLREFSKAKIAHRTGSASSQRLRRRERLATHNNGIFVTQHQVSPGSTADMAINGLQINGTAPSDAGKAFNARSSSAMTGRTDGDEQVTNGTSVHQDVTDGEKDAGKGDSGVGTSDMVSSNDKGVTQDGDGASSSQKDSAENQPQDADINSKSSNALNTSNTDASGTADSNQQGTNNVDQDRTNRTDPVDGSNNPEDDGNNPGNHHRNSNHGNSNHGAEDSNEAVENDGEIGKDRDASTVSNKEARGRGGGGGGGGGGGDMDPAHADGDGSVKASGDGDAGLDGEEGHEKEASTSGSRPSSPSQDMLQISLTPGITLVSKTSTVRNKNEVFMTNFDDPKSFQEGFRDEMETIRREKDLQNNASDIDDNEGDDVDNEDAEDESKKYPLKTQDTEIARMEEKLQKVKLLEAGISNVGHLEESRGDLDELRKEEEEAENVADGEYETGVFSQVKNDEEMKEADEKRKEEEKRKEKRYRTPYKSTLNAGASDGNKEVKKPYKFKLSDIYNFINSRQRAIFEQKFEELDKNSDGKVTLKELGKQMKKSDVPKTEVKKFMQVFDLNNDKTIDKREFVTVAALNDKLTGHVTQTDKEPLRLDLDTLSFNITAYKEAEGLEHTTLEEVDEEGEK